MNMIITGDGHTNVKQIDSLSSPVDELYDVVLANPPYGQDTDYGNYYPIPSEEGDSVFIQHMFKALKSGGRAAVVVPEGFLFRPSDLRVRKYLLERCNFKAIISLPVGVFRPYTKNKTDIIIFKKDLDQVHPKGTNSVWFYDLKADGFELDSDLRLPIQENDISDLLSKYSTQLVSSKSWVIGINEIRKNNYDLLAKTYRPRQARYYSRYPFVKFSKIMHECNDVIDIDDNTDYARITVKLHGQGVVLRDIRNGNKIKTKKQKIVKRGQFIVAELDAKFGAFGVIPADLEGSIVSSHYWLFDLDKSQVLPEYFDYIIRKGPFEELISPKVRGTTNYAAPRPKDILELEAPLPGIEIQREVVRKLGKKIEAKKIAELEFERMLKDLVMEPSFGEDVTQSEGEKMVYELHQSSMRGSLLDFDKQHKVDK